MNEHWSDKYLVSSLVGLFFAIAVVISQQFITLPYFILSPGSATPVADYIEVPPEKAFPPKGDVLFTTVQVVHARPFDMVWAWLTPHNRIEKQHDLIGDSTPEQYYEANEKSMAESQMVATYVAMKRAGYDVRFVGEGALIENVARGAPAEGLLHPGDTITAVNGKQIGLASDVSEMVRPLSTGTAVHLDVSDSTNAKRTVEVTTGARPNGGGSYLGVALRTKNSHLDGPFPVNLNIERVGGPSAGLAFTLSALDELTSGELTGGRKIATTGTIEIDGTVGEVGGVEQKTQAVVKSGVKLFLVPLAEAEEAQKHASKGLQVVGVRNLDDALAALRDNGGDTSGLPLSPR